MGEKVTTTRRRGGRLVVPVVMCLIAGFVVQTLVAFGSARFGATASDIYSAGRLAQTASIERYDGAAVVYRGSLWGVHAFLVVLRPEFPAEKIQTMGRIPSWVALPAIRGYGRWPTMGFGWPLPSWQGNEGGLLVAVPIVRQPRTWQRRLGLQRHDLQSVRPIPINTLINSAFYGLLISPLWLAVIKARRAWRRRSRPGTCTHCGYALAGLPAAARCPECGRER